MPVEGFPPWVVPPDMVKGNGLNDTGGVMGMVHDVFEDIEERSNGRVMYCPLSVSGVFEGEVPMSLHQTPVCMCGSCAGMAVVLSLFTCSTVIALLPAHSAAHHMNFIECMYGRQCLTCLGGSVISHLLLCVSIL